MCIKNKTKKRIYILTASVVVLLIGLYLFFYNYYDQKFYSLYKKMLQPYRKQKTVFSAIQHGDLDFLKELITKGHDVQGKNNAGETPVTFAFCLRIFSGKRGHTFTPEELEKINKKTYEIIKLLVEHGSDINEFNTRRESPLFLAIQYDMYHVAEMLLKYDAQTDVLVTPEEKPHLYYALIHDADREKRSYFDLLARNGAKVNIRDNKGDALLHMAIKENLDINSVKPLFETNFDISLKNNQGETGLDLALKMGRDDYIDFLRKHNVPE